MNRQTMSLIIEEAKKVTALNPEDRFVENLVEVEAFVNLARKLGREIVMTQGTFDLIHIGHARYVREAKKRGNILILGIDSDEKTRKRKGENRPVVPFVERREMMVHLRYVDLVTVKKSDYSKWQLIKLIRPEVLVGVEGTYSPKELEELRELCCEVLILPRQADTSTSAKVRKLILDGAENLTRILIERLPQFVQSVYQELKDGKK